MAETANSHESTKSHRKATTVFLLGREIAVQTGVDRLRNKDYFLRFLGIESIDVVRMDSPLSREEMRQCIDALLRHVHSASPIDNPISAYVYTTHEGSLDRIDMDHTHAFSILAFNNGALEHHYYEKESSQEFREIGELSSRINGPLDSDLVRLLHFANTPGYELASKSSIFVFAGGEVEGIFHATEPAYSLQHALLMDPDRNKGYVTLGLNEPEIYIALMDNDPTSEFTCGHDDGCPLGQDSCVWDPSLPINYCSYLPAPPDCAVSELAAMKRRNEVSFNVPLRFGLLRSFRDDFLSKSKFGREYAGYYYVLSSYAQYDVGALRDYVTALPDVYRAIADLMSDCDLERVIVTSELRDRALSIIERHREIRQPTVQRIIERIESDLDRLHGLRKRDLLEAIGMRQPE
jgi:hypothetical protein